MKNVEPIKIFKMSILDYIIFGSIIFISTIFLIALILLITEYYSNKDVRGGIISRFFLRRLRNRLSTQCQILSWYIGVERNEDPVIHDKYDRNSDLLIQLKYLIKNGL